MGKYRKYDFTFKVTALDFLKNHKLEETARVFGVDGKRVREWRANEQELRRMCEAQEGSRKRLPGGGLKVRNQELEEILKSWICEQRERRLRISRKMIQLKAKEICADTNFSASDGWLQRFLVRNNFSMRKRTSKVSEDGIIRSYPCCITSVSPPYTLNYLWFRGF